MLSLPTFRQLTNAAERQTYAEQYEACSGLPVPQEYLLSPDTNVFGIYYQKTLIGGFMLGFGQDFRTVQLFAQQEAQPAVKASMGNAADYTELCCLWLARRHRTTFVINTFTWLVMLYALLRFANRRLLFGTCSLSLARLYATSKKTNLLHEDFVQRKRTFIFTAQKQDYFVGILNVLWHKCGRTLRLSRWNFRLKQAR